MTPSWGKNWLHGSKGACGQGSGAWLKDCKARASPQTQGRGLDTSPSGLTTSLLPLPPTLCADRMAGLPIQRA